MEDQPRVCATMTTCPCGRGEFYCYWGEKTKTQTWLILNFRGKDPRSPNNLVILLKITRTEREKEHWEFLKTAPPVPPTPTLRSSRQLMCSSARGPDPDPEIIVSLEETEQNELIMLLHAQRNETVHILLSGGRKKKPSVFIENETHN